MFVWIEESRSDSDPVAETGGTLDGMLISGQMGFANGTHVASNLGWRPVEALSVGDKVLTFDHGMQTIVEIRQETLFADVRDLPEAQWPVLIPEGALHNRKDMWLMPDQGIFVESDAASDAMGDPFAVVPARALEGLRKICRAEPPQAMEITVLCFARDEVIYVEGGMLAHCPRPRNLLVDDVAQDEVLYDVLDMTAARFLVECMMTGGSAAGLTYRAEEVARVA